MSHEDVGAAGNYLIVSDAYDCEVSPTFTVYRYPRNNAVSMPEVFELSSLSSIMIKIHTTEVSLASATPDGLTGRASAFT